MQEIGIRLKADTAEAVKDVQELDRNIKGMENLEKKGNASEGFLNRKDVEEFKRLSEEAERVHRSFQEKLNRSARELEQKRATLADAKARGAGESATSSIERDIKELEAQRKQFEHAQTRAETQMNRHQQATATVSDYNTEPGGIPGGIYALGGATVGKMAGMLGGAFAISQAYQGMGLIRSEEAQSAQLGQRIPGTDGDFTEVRRQASDAGREYGNAYTATETLETAEQYTALAGATDADSTFGAVSDIQTGSRVMGIDPSILAGAIGGLEQMGAVDKASIRDFQEGMVGAIKQTGMDGRDAEFTQAVTGLAEQVGRGQMSFGNAELSNILGLQTLLGQTGEPGLQGQRGADVLGNIDSAVKGSDNRLDLMLGWGTDYKGLEGRAELERLKAGGIGDPELLGKLMTNMETAFGGDKDMMALFMQDAMGISIEQADALLKDDVFSQLKQGTMDEAKLKEMTETGEDEMLKRSEDWQDSDAQRRAENDADMEETKRALGFLPDKIFEGAKDLFTNLPSELQALSIAGAGAGGMAMTGKMFKGMGPKVGDTLKGGKDTGMLKGFGDKMKGAGKGAGKLLKGSGGKMLGTAGAMITANELTESGIDSISDFLFGYEEGDVKRSEREYSFFADENIRDPRKWDEVDESKKYQESKKGVIGRTWDWLFGGEEAEASEMPHGGGAETMPLKADPNAPDEIVAFDTGAPEAQAPPTYPDAPDDIITFDTGAPEAQTPPADPDAPAPMTPYTSDLFSTEAPQFDQPFNTDEDGRTGVMDLFNQQDKPKTDDEPKRGIMAMFGPEDKPKTDDEPGGIFDPFNLDEGETGTPTLFNANESANPNEIKGTPEEQAINARRALQDQQAELLDREKKIIDERKGLLGLGTFGTSAMLGMGGGGEGGGDGILGVALTKLFEGILGGGTAEASSSSAVDGGDLTERSLKASNTMTAKEIDAWINAKAPSNSVLRGKGSAFARASQESGLDARYLVSHAVHETGWGTSNIARNKGNMYGIGAFDASPYSSAYNYDNTEAGIIEGAKWIAQNYTNKGQDTLKSMRYNNGQHEYATDPNWHTKIANIMKGASGFGGGAPFGGGAGFDQPVPQTQRIEVVVSGQIDNMTRENNDQVADAIRTAILNETQYNLGQSYRQGVGGDR